MLTGSIFYCRKRTELEIILRNNLSCRYFEMSIFDTVIQNGASNKVAF